MNTVPGYTVFRGVIFVVLALCAGPLVTPAAAQITTASIDRFSTSSASWAVGSAGIQPTFNGGTSFDGQPGFLRHFSDGTGPNGRFIMWNEQPKWLGNYTAAGVGSITMMVDGVSGTNTSLYIGFDGPGGWFRSSPQTVVTADNWKEFVFNVDPSNLFYVSGSGGTGLLADTLADVDRFAIFAGSGAVTYASTGDLIRTNTSTNVLSFDNIAATPVPEPTSILGVCAGVVATFVAYRRRRAAQNMPETRVSG
jgi:hypothetical protein